MKICTRVHDFGKNTAENLSVFASVFGFDGVQLVLNKAINGETGLPGTLNTEKAQQIAFEFNKNNIEIAMLGAYFNPVHSNKELVNQSIAKFKEHLKYAKDFNTSYVGSETGSYNDDKWTYNPLNRTEEAYNEVKRIFKDLVDYAKEVGSYVAVEGAYGHCMYEPKRLKRLFDEIDNGHMRIIVDVYNYLNIENYQNHTQIFDECQELFKDKIVVFHLKDFIVKDNKLIQVGLGQGLMNYDYIMPRIIKNNPNAYLVFEGIQPKDAISSLEFIKKYLK